MLAFPSSYFYPGQARRANDAGDQASFSPPVSDRGAIKSSDPNKKSPGSGRLGGAPTRAIGASFWPRQEPKFAVSVVAVSSCRSRRSCGVWRYGGATSCRWHLCAKCLAERNPRTLSDRQLVTPRTRSHPPHTTCTALCFAFVGEAQLPARWSDFLVHCLGCLLLGLAPSGSDILVLQCACQGLKTSDSYRASLEKLFAAAALLPSGGLFRAPG